ncbi:DUF1906 domain-containing protein [Nocardia puris]|uniref:Uncharacterized protein DUF1906 n=1 Tax=Nocardia puris TaxID=208602 RepID=A0A366DRH0_9NOCA|nr:DUF1906 domain-containing protein [Nocardia puris]MBF6210825.1 DUF1906 domain-containing protein [Nocardia puris]MBF6364420.1 DUF1906 domain-containing protein [Nocardia puris]MBF6459349.1 DUF1906 domain-containing protein [Nocardia puris]RBO92691.1 uncharacterized protein DUF1906 [Nocardia puris]
MRSSDLSRRKLFAYTAAAAAVGITATAGRASAASLGTLIDYSGGVPSATAIRDAGHLGVIRYVSDRRPGAEWMAGKPLRANEVEALNEAGLKIVSCYQFGKGPTADWRGGLEAGKKHAERGLELHLAAGGPEDRPIYASIDDNPTAVEFATMIAPYLLGWEAVLGKRNVGVYANTPTIDLARAAGLGSWFWQHNWGTPKGYVHPAAHLHQFEIDKRAIDGIGIDLNNILKPEYGQW